MIEFLEELESDVERETTVCGSMSEIKLGKSGKKFCNIVHMNIRSLRKNFDELLLYLESVGVECLDVIVLSETWRIENLNDFMIPNFDILYNESHFNQNDGVIVYIKSSIGYTTSIHQMSEINLLEVNFKLNNRSYRITTCYRPPSTDLVKYIHEMNHYFEAQSEYDVGVFVGDVNINLLNTSDINVTEYISMMEEQGFFSYVDKPSRITQTSSTS